MSWIAEILLEFLVEPIFYLFVFILSLIGFLPVYWCVKIFDDSKTIGQIWKEYNTTSAFVGFFMLIGFSVAYAKFLI